MTKFGKNREVDSTYLNVPVKYITNYVGANEGGKDKYSDIPFEEWKKDMENLSGELGIKFETNLDAYCAWLKECKENGYDYECKKLVKEGKDKTLCIVDFYYGGRRALVAWRNNKTYKMGMTHMCDVVKKNNKTYIDYHGKLILIDKWGWVW